MKDSIRYSSNNYIYPSGMLPSNNFFRPVQLFPNYKYFKDDGEMKQKSSPVKPVIYPVEPVETCCKKEKISADIETIKFKRLDPHV